MCNGDRELCVQKASKFFAIVAQDTIEIRMCSPLVERNYGYCNIQVLVQLLPKLGRKRENLLLVNKRTKRKSFRQITAPKRQ